MTWVDLFKTSDWLDDVTAKTHVYGVSIIKENSRAKKILSVCSNTMGFVYNILHGENVTDESYLQNIYFGADDDGCKIFNIYFGETIFQLSSNNSLSDLNDLKLEWYHKHNVLTKISKVKGNWNLKLFDVQNRYIFGLGVTLPDMFYIRDMPELKPASIKIESRRIKDLLRDHRVYYDYRNIGIFFEELPKDIFDKLVCANKELDLGYKIYAKEN